MATLRIRNWDKWQSYRQDRGAPPWIKVHRNLFTNPEWASLTDAEKGHIVSIWLVGADKKGEIPADANLLRKICMLDNNPNLQTFIDKGFLELVDDYHADATLTPPCQPNDPPETETETETEEEKKALSDESDGEGEEPFYLTAKKKKLKGKRLETFNLFWDAFAYKAGKAEAADSWLAIPTLTDTLVDQIVSAAKRDAALREGIIQKGSTPIMAQGWLTRRRWEDESRLVPASGGDPVAGAGGVKPPKNAAAAIARKLLEDKYGTQSGHHEQRNPAVESAIPLPAPGTGGVGDSRR